MNALRDTLIERTILPRRYGISSGRTFVYGAPKVGKTSLALQFALSFKKPFYIDLGDMRVKKDEAQAHLLKIYLEKELDVLVLDNYKKDMFGNFLGVDSHQFLPNLQDIVLIGNRQECPIGFVPKCILPLCFEEFVSFDTKNFSLKNLFTLFLKEGNLAQMFETSAYKRLQTKREFLQSALQSQAELFFKILPFQAQNIAPNALYERLKKQMRISKDTLYATLRQWEENGVIFYVSNALHKGSKKLYFFDFSLPSLVCFEKNLSTQLENMLFLELCKICEQSALKEWSNELFCCAMGEFYMRDCAYIFIPFATRELIAQKIPHIDCKNIAIITLSFEDEGLISGKKYRAMQFVDFALGEAYW